MLAIFPFFSWNQHGKIIGCVESGWMDIKQNMFVEVTWVVLGNVRNMYLRHRKPFHFPTGCLFFLQSLFQVLNAFYCSKDISFVQ